MTKFEKGFWTGALSVSFFAAAVAWVTDANAHPWYVKHSRAIAVETHPQAVVNCGQVRFELGELLNDGALAQHESCLVTVRPDWPLYATIPQLCAVIMHEYGHAAGLDHSDDPESIMFYSGPRTAPRKCQLLNEVRVANVSIRSDRDQLRRARKRGDREWVGYMRESIDKHRQHRAKVLSQLP